MSAQSLPEIVIDHVCELGEGPVWDAANKCILWLDIKRGEIHEYNVQTKRHNYFSAGEMIGCITQTESGKLIAGLQNSIGFIDIENKAVQHIIQSPDGKDNRFNDGKCDAAGRFWVGTMALNEEENKGSLYVVETDLTIKKKVDNVTISNGIAWNADSTVMYYINTPTKYIFAFDFDMVTGEIMNQKVVIDLTHENGYADGMTIDEEGMLWIAFYGGWRVARYDPGSGKLLQKIELPVENVTCCSFGGEHLNDLYITTASQGMNEELLKQQPHAGKLFVVKNMNIKGTLPYKFKG